MWMSSGGQEYPLTGVDRGQEYPLTGVDMQLFLMQQNIDVIIFH